MRPKRKASPTAELVPGCFIRKLPLEVLYHIVDQIAVHTERHAVLGCDFLYDYEEAEAKDALVAFSLVSRLFRLVTLPHLFHTVAFWIQHSKEDPTLHDESHAQEYTPGCRTVESLLAFVNAFPSIAIFICDLRIGKADYLDKSGPEFDVVEFLALLYQLPKLRAVELDNVFWPARHDLGTLPRLRFPLCLDRLIIAGGPGVLDDPYSITSAYLAPVLKQLGEVGTIRFREIAFRSSEDPGDLFWYTRGGDEAYSDLLTGLGEPVSVSALIFERCLSVGQILADFDEGPRLAFSPEDLELLVLCCLPEEVAQAAHTLSVFGANLKTFKLHLQSAFSDELWFDGSDPVSFDLHSCLALQDLTLIWEHDDDDDDDMLVSSAAPLCSILSSLRDHKDLHTVSLWVRFKANSPCEIWLDPEFMRAVEEELLLLQSVRTITLDCDI